MTVESFDREEMTASECNEACGGFFFDSLGEILNKDLINDLAQLVR